MDLFNNPPRLSSRKSTYIQRQGRRYGLLKKGYTGYFNAVKKNCACSKQKQTIFFQDVHHLIPFF